MAVWIIVSQHDRLWKQWTNQSRFVITICLYQQVWYAVSVAKIKEFTTVYGAVRCDLHFTQNVTLCCAQQFILFCYSLHCCYGTRSIYQDLDNGSATHFYTCFPAQPQIWSLSEIINLRRFDHSSLFELIPLVNWTLRSTQQTVKCTAPPKIETVKFTN